MKSGSAVILAALLLGAGCRSTSPPDRYLDVDVHAPAAPVGKASCPQTGAGMWFLPRPTKTNPAIPTGSVPPDFVATAVTVCSSDPERTVAVDRRHHRYHVQENVGPVTGALLTSLSLPDQKLPADSQVACGANATYPPYVLLVDSRSQAIRPRLPQDSCGNPRPEVTAALSALELTIRRSYEVTVLDP